ncbi:hypothetical protein [Deinococcus cellulosilyticus]|uniref:Uncharacterized protein n=1 Tax=Deinococcus cellulosilyticus (strain DSM 18568 / NBRC 106333 / KACC 11606 / 5516J-15) TaxID=1223518 RepID=A0A511N484_DEIC1|nr:hypothetical protein [Deinococcus cellulosilyticus]GEM47278.1 hypothetical protein DC3_29130 [Deinococcus cellulosilyticus NBRC 106333 = KACC 11606]
MKGLLIAGGLLVLVVAGVAVRSLTHRPMPEDLDRHVREGTASRTQLKTINHVIKDSEGNVLLDCRAGVNRLPEELRGQYTCE